jgi:hypothetical protein
MIKYLDIFHKLVAQSNDPISHALLGYNYQMLGKQVEANELFEQGIRLRNQLGAQNRSSSLDLEEESKQPSVPASPTSNVNTITVPPKRIHQPQEGKE